MSSFEGPFKQGDPDQIFRRMLTTINRSTVEGLAKELTEKAELEAGPLPKNQATYDFEHIITTMIKNPDSVEILFVNGNYIAKVEDKEYNLSKIMHDMEARFIDLPEEILNKRAEQSKLQERLREDLIVRYANKYHITRDEAQFEFQSKYGHLSLAEINAVQLYSGNDYKAMNGIMRGQDPRTIENPLNQENGLPPVLLKHFLINSAMALNGLNKVPSQPVETAYAYRAEWNQGQFYDQALAKGEPVKLQGFVSTSADNVHFSGDNYMVMHDVRGLNITDISYFGHENEILLPPTQILLEKKKSDGNKNYYIGRPVMTPTGLTKDEMSVGMSIEEKSRKLPQLLEAVKELEEGYKELSLFEKAQCKFAINDLIETANKLSGDSRLKDDEKFDIMMAKLKNAKGTIQNILMEIQKSQARSERESQAQRENRGGILNQMGSSSQRSANAFDQASADKEARKEERAAKLGKMGQAIQNPSGKNRPRSGGSGSGS